MIPLGPRLSQPTTYSPGTCHSPPPIAGATACVTRPNAFGTTPRAASKGTDCLNRSGSWCDFTVKCSSRGFERYPTERSASATFRIVSVAPVLTARRFPGGPESSFISKITDPSDVASSSRATNFDGDRRKRTESSFLFLFFRPTPIDSSASPFWSISFVSFPLAFLFSIASRARRRGRLASRSASSKSVTASSYTRTSTSGRFRSSRSSFGENAACATPRLPMSATFFTAERSSVCNAAAHMSVSRKSLTSRNKTRAQSSATLPNPKITAVGASFFGSSCVHASSDTSRCRVRQAVISSCNETFFAPRDFEVSTSSPCASGSPLNHPTNRRAEMAPRSVSSPGTSRVRSPVAPYASTTAWYRGVRSSTDTSRPSAAFPKKQTRGSLKTPSNRLTTDFVDAWSGATPERTKPKGTGLLSRMSTRAEAP
mmetsp:Transcript_13571/g.57038  ORF Transcript_13571/g.57038 Transcript_13571/m.57038 type:complete len:428 (+) Transcript_13571:914-2197(+)